MMVCRAACPALNRTTPSNYIFIGMTEILLVIRAGGGGWGGGGGGVSTLVPSLHCT